MDAWPSIRPTGRWCVADVATSGHLSFYEGVWYRVREDQPPSPITAGEAMSLRPLDVATIVNVSHGWMLHHAQSQRAWALSEEVKDGAQALVRRTMQLAGVLG